MNFSSPLMSVLFFFSVLISLVSSETPLIIAHRGASGTAPENTMEAFNLAWNLGADGIEGDFHLTHDGHIVAIHDADSDIVSQTTRGKDYKDRLPNGNYLDNTASHFVLIVGDSPETALISMKSTQLKVSRKWNSMMMGLKMQGKNGLFTPPTYSHIYNLSTVQMSNDKGTWFGWDVSKVGPVTDKAMYDMAKSFAESVGKGEVQAKHGSEETTKGSSNY